MSDYVYTEDDVLSKTSEAKAHEGEYGWFSQLKKDVIGYANENNTPLYGMLIPSNDINFPFGWDKNSNTFNFFIPKHKPEKKYMPFDLSDEKTRIDLVGRKIIEKDNKEAWSIAGISKSVVTWDWRICLLEDDFDAEELLERFTFEDGTPCGEEVVE